MRIEDYFIVVVAVIAILLGTYTIIKGESTSFRPPTATELITGMRVDIVSEFSQLLSQTSALAQIELATTLPCAQVIVSSSVSNNHTYYGLETNFDGCR